MKTFYKALKICTFCVPLPNSNRCWASFQTDQWHWYQCLFILVSSWTDVRLIWSKFFFFFFGQNILGLASMSLGTGKGDMLENINWLKPKLLSESTGFNALGNILDSQYKASGQNEKFLHSQNNFILRNTICMSWCTVLSPLMIRPPSVLSNYFIFFSQCSNTIPTIYEFLNGSLDQQS